MGIAMDADFMAGIGDSLHLFRERLDRMAGHEPGRLDAEFFKQFQQPRAADFASK